MISELLKTLEYYEKRGDCANALPEFKNTYIGDNEFRIAIEGFSEEECEGHFPGFVLTSGGFIVSSILSGIKEWLFKEGIQAGSVLIENPDLFINNAAPVGMELSAEVSVEMLLTKVYLFTTEIIDKRGNHYGFYLITIEIK